jgi:hypothetical protein
VVCGPCGPYVDHFPACPKYPCGPPGPHGPHAQIATLCNTFRKALRRLTDPVVEKLINTHSEKSLQLYDRRTFPSSSSSPLLVDSIDRPQHRAGRMPHLEISREHQRGAVAALLLLHAACCRGKGTEEIMHRGTKALAQLAGTVGGTVHIGAGRLPPENLGAHVR